MTVTVHFHCDWSITPCICVCVCRLLCFSLLQRVKFELQKVIIHGESIIFEMFPLLFYYPPLIMFTIFYTSVVLHSFGWCESQCRSKSACPMSTYSALVSPLQPIPPTGQKRSKHLPCIKMACIKSLRSLKFLSHSLDSWQTRLSFCISCSSFALIPFFLESNRPLLGYFLLLHVKHTVKPIWV